MQTKHTPGPWKVTPHASGYHAFIETADFDEEMRTGEIVATTRDSTHSTANARLIAAAPDLLEACRRMAKLYRSNPRIGKDFQRDDLGCAIIEIETAIARAEGGAR